MMQDDPVGLSGRQEKRGARPPKNLLPIEGIELHREDPGQVH